MKRRNHKIGKTGVSLIIVGVAVAALLTSAHAQTAPASSNANTMRTSNEQSVFHSLEEAVEAVRYDVRRENTVESGEPSFRALNPAQRYHAQFTAKGVSLAPMKASPNSAEVHPPGWHATMRLTGYGYGENLLTVGTAEITASAKRIEYRRAWPPITEWYVNAAAGLEQGFVLAKAPGARLSGERLRLVLELTGDLIPEMAEGGGESVALKQPNGDLALTYSDLRAYDAERRALPAQMKVRDNCIILEVNDEGAVYPVTIDPIFALQTKLTAGDGAPNDRFGRSVAISGNTAVIGAFYDDVNGNVDQGSAYVFFGNGTTWVQQAQLTASDGAAGDQFGWSVGISGDKIVVGAPNHVVPNARDRGSVYVFVRYGRTWSQQANFNYQNVLSPIDIFKTETTVFGWSVAISGDTIVVGTPTIDALAITGKAFVYVLDNMGGWSKQTTLPNSTYSIYDTDTKFGWSVAISGDTVVVGAPYEDVQLWVWPVPSPIQVDQGAAYVFVRSNGTWSQQAKFPSGYTPQGSYVDGAAGDHFGSAVAISRNRIVVGAPNDDIGSNTDQGSAYVFTRSNSIWTLQEKLTATDGAAGDNFGHSVAIADSAVIGGSDILVGAPYDDIGAKADQGSAYTFVCNGPCFAFQKLTASDGAAHDAFGNSVAIDAGTVVVGAILADISRPLCFTTICTNVDQGSAYIFVR